MKYILIKGSFHVVGYSPDGDSMMFRADNAKHWQGLVAQNTTLFAEKIAKGALQLRLQGIDALETHYSPPPLRTPKNLKGKATDKQSKPKPSGSHQPAEIGQMATDKFLEIVGVTETKWRRWGSTTWIDKACIPQQGQAVWIDKKHEDVLPGYIVASEVEKNGRPLAWVFAGSCRYKDGAELSKESLAKRLRQSVNYQLLQKGLVYPYFYMGLANVLRKKMITATKLARNAAKRKHKALAKKSIKSTEKVANLWFYDRSLDKGLKVTNLDTLANDAEIFPYLFRKAVKTGYRQQMQAYWQAVEQKKAFKFDKEDKSVQISALLEDGNPRIFISSEQDFVRLDEILSLENNTLKLRYHPMDLVFLS